MSPLAASRFNRPFERAKAGHGSNFEGRGVGGWGLGALVSRVGMGVVVALERRMETVR